MEDWGENAILAFVSLYNTHDYCMFISGTCGMSILVYNHCFVCRGGKCWRRGRTPAGLPNLCLPLLLAPASAGTIAPTTLNSGLVK